MKIFSIVTGVVFFVAAATTALAAEPTASEITAAGAAYRKTCLHCHQPPDLRFPTDRTWLDQVNRTA